MRLFGGSPAFCIILSTPRKVVLLPFTVTFLDFIRVFSVLLVMLLFIAFLSFLWIALAPTLTGVIAVLAALFLAKAFAASFVTSAIALIGRVVFLQAFLALLARRGKWAILRFSSVAFSAFTRCFVHATSVTQNGKTCNMPRCFILATS